MRRLRSRLPRRSRICTCGNSRGHCPAEPDGGRIARPRFGAPARTSSPKNRPSRGRNTFAGRSDAVAGQKVAGLFRARVFPGETRRASAAGFPATETRPGETCGMFPTGKERFGDLPEHFPPRSRLRAGGLGAPARRTPRLRWSVGRSRSPLRCRGRAASERRSSCRSPRRRSAPALRRCGRSRSHALCRWPAARWCGRPPRRCRRWPR